jgi:hypothetical protein
MGFLVLNKLGTRVSPSILASRLRCDGLEAADGRVERGYRMALFNRLPLRRTPGKIQVPRNNQQEETIDLGVISDREIWIVIQYLDPELDRRECDRPAITPAMKCFPTMKSGRFGTSNRYTSLLSSTLWPALLWCFGEYNTTRLPIARSARPAQPNCCGRILSRISMER